MAMRIIQAKGVVAKKKDVLKEFEHHQYLVSNIAQIKVVKVSLDPTDHDVLNRESKTQRYINIDDSVQTVDELDEVPKMLQVKKKLNVKRVKSKQKLVSKK